MTVSFRETHKNKSQDMKGNPLCTGNNFKNNILIYAACAIPVTKGAFVGFVKSDYAVIHY